MDTNLLRTGKEDVRLLGTFTRNQDIRIHYDQKEGCFYYYDYLPPGVHNYKIYWQKGQSAEECQVLMQGNIFIKPRDKEIKVNVDKTLFDSSLKSKQFVKEKSVFADFKLDDEHTLKRAFELDVRRFKLKDLQIKKTEVNFHQYILMFVHRLIKSYCIYLVNTLQ